MSDERTSGNISTWPEGAAKDKYLQMSTAELAREFGVSERTARRHKARGTLPAVDRRKGFGGGTWPACSPRALPFTWTFRQLLPARAAVRRASRVESVSHEELCLAMQIRDDINAAIRRWTDAD